jgi:polyphosphate kinase
MPRGISNRRVRPSPAPEAADQVSPERFLNRDLSWLEFNRRVLHEALDARTPLLERVRFLSIFSSNLDEFFMKRVSAIRQQVVAGKAGIAADGLTPARKLAAIRSTVLSLLQQQTDCYLREIRPALAAQGVHLLAWRDLTEAERAECVAFFRETVYPILTPLAVDFGHPFPFISNLSESLGIALMQPGEDKTLFARVKIPETVPRWVRLRAGNGEGGTYRFASLYDMIREHLGQLFPGMQITAAAAFRVTRTIDLELDEEDAQDLRELIAQELRLRRFAPVVRLEIEAGADPWIQRFLMHELELTDNDVYPLGGEVDYQDLKPISTLPIAALAHEPWTPVVPRALADEDSDIFSIIRSGDLMVHHPYESFAASVERFIRAAAADPRVLAIKMTLYRTSDESPFIYTLIQAAEARKQVVCLVELKARLDEERNIMLAEALEKAGVHVVYGLVGLKTHTKAALVVRQDPDRIRCYAHIGTGNYHNITASLYSDLGLLTCDPAITEELVALFHSLTGRSVQPAYRKLLVAPVQMRERFLALIEREAEHQKAGRPARIIAKMNSLEDRRIIDALYAAGQAGVKIDLIVRGFCCLRPQVKGLSENIRVISIVGRFLEHARVFYFCNGASRPVDGEFYIGSADWMYRNLLQRVEVVVPVEAAAHRERLWELLQINLNDNRQAWDMAGDGTYVQRRPADNEPARGTHSILMALARRDSALLSGAADPDPSANVLPPV